MRLDYSLTRTEEDIENEDIDVMTHIFFTEDKIHNYEESLQQFTETYYITLSLLDESNVCEAERLHDIYCERTKKVEDLVEKLVSSFIYYYDLRICSFVRNLMNKW